MGSTLVPFLPGLSSAFPHRSGFCPTSCSSLRTRYWCEVLPRGWDIYRRSRDVTITKWSPGGGAVDCDRAPSGAKGLCIEFVIRARPRLTSGRPWHLFPPCKKAPRRPSRARPVRSHGLGSPKTGRQPPGPPAPSPSEPLPPSGLASRSPVRGAFAFGHPQGKLRTASTRCRAPPSRLNGRAQ
jgi:hypothetical protein